MEIISPQFALFVAATLLLYYALPGRFQNLILAAACAVFLASWGTASAGTLLLTTALTCGVLWALRRERRRLWLILGVGLNLCLLLAYRFISGPYGDDLLRLFHSPLADQGNGLKMLLPIGVAFYELQAVTLIIEAYEGRLAAFSLTNCIIYLAYFPKLLAGPIERPRVFLPQLARARVPSDARVSEGLGLILLGLVRKKLIADVLTSTLPRYLWSGVRDGYHSIDLWLWLLTFTFTLYNDFAGYSNIVQGLSLLFGIKLSANFNQPFFAATFSEFWNRWHISLSNWLRDTVYMPVSRWLRRRYPEADHWANIIIPPTATMLISGMWHGLSAAMLIWGGLHGLYQVLERIIYLRYPSARPGEAWNGRRFAGTAIVFVLTTLAWVPFALPSMRSNAGALELWRALLIVPNWTSAHPWLLVVAAPMCLSLGLDWTQYRSRDALPFRGWPRLAQAFLISSAVLGLVIVGLVSVGQTFVYQGF